MKKLLHPKKKLTPFWKFAIIFLKNRRTLKLWPELKFNFLVATLLLNLHKPPQVKSNLKGMPNAKSGIKQLLSQAITPFFFWSSVRLFQLPPRVAVSGRLLTVEGSSELDISLDIDEKPLRFHNCMNIHDESWIICGGNIRRAHPQFARDEHIFYSGCKTFLIRASCDYFSSVFASPLLPARAVRLMPKVILPSAARWARSGRELVSVSDSHWRSRAKRNKMFRAAESFVCEKKQTHLKSVLSNNSTVLHSQLLQFRARSRNRWT